MAGAAFVAVPEAGAAVTAGSFGISPSPALPVYTGLTGQSASNETFTLENNWSQNDTITFTVSPSDSATGNCTASSTDYVEFAGNPTVNAVATGGNNASDVAPTFSAALSSNNTHDNGCSALTDVLTLTITNAPKGTSTDTWNVTMSNITYSVGSGTATGLVHLVSVPSGAVANANVVNKASAGATANSPVTYITSGGSGAISNIVVTETTAGAAATTICVAPIDGVTSFSFTGTPSTAASPTGSGAGTVTSTAVTGGDILVTISKSTSVATTYTISGITVSDGSGTGPAYASVTTGGANCGADSANVIAAQLQVFDSAPVVQNAIYGQDADATAIAEMTQAFPPNGCPANHTVILATDQTFPDALSASYLAGYLGSGILLTPTAQLSSETQTALENFGITSVYVVGGTLAVSQNTINEVEATPSYPCGGPTAGASTGKIAVATTLAGTDQYGTAQAIDAQPPQSYVGALDLSGAYAGQYNDTAGNGSSTPEASGALKTAIVATGTSFQDAAGASVLAYNDHLPMVLTDPNSLSSEAADTLQGLGIQQVIVLGGPLAVSNADVTSIQALNISVIRIAGQDLTDTAQMLATFELQSSSGHAGLGWSATWNNQILVARGDFYSDALAGCVLANLGPSPLLLTLSPSTVGTYLTTFLQAGGSAAGIDQLGSAGNIQSIQPLGGPLALYTSTLQTMAQDVAAG